MPVKGWRADPIKRLLAKIDIRGEGECWFWKAGKSSKGYGSFMLEGKAISAPRAVTLLLKNEPLTADWRRQSPGKGSIGSRREVRHLCNNPGCCNPAHLIYGNQSENRLDYIISNTFKPPKSKLTSADYIAILTNPEPAYAAAKRFNININQVHAIRQKRVLAVRKLFTCIVTPW